MGWARDAARGTLDLLFPPAARCALCGTGGETVPGEGMCPRCAAPLAAAGEPACPRCGRGVPSEGACRNCRERPPRYRRGAVALRYEGAVREAMLRLKFQGELSLLDFFADRMARRLAESGWPPMDALAAVPSHPLRVLGRGFSLPSRLAARLSRLTGIPLARGALRRASYAAMPGSGRGERLKLARRAFAPGHAAAVRGKRVLLVDDILTTGATMDACAELILRMGAAEAYALAAAGVAQETAGNGGGGIV